MNIASILKDAALERRFQKVLVDEPSVEDTIAILRGFKREIYNPSRRTDFGFCDYCRGKMSHRYITDRQLPDKAIDLIDEAASRIKWRSTLSQRHWISLIAVSSS